MSATLIHDALPGEDLTGIEPALSQQVDNTTWWLQRLSLFSGRTLTAPALQSEQAYRAGRLAILGQCVTQGAVKGLELTADLTQPDLLLQVTPGYGISTTGEDVTLVRTLRTSLNSLFVIDSDAAKIVDFPSFSKDPDHTNHAGVLVLQPVTAQVSGSAVDTGALPVIVSGNLGASCDQDPEEYAFEDWQIVDGARLVMVAWPSVLGSISVPSTDPTFQNQLVYKIFTAEMALASDDRLPWDLAGVPLALIGFDNAWKPQFVDRSAVVRTGGLPRGRYVLPAEALPQPDKSDALLLVQPALAQARVTQLTEQLNETPALTNLVQSFALLPPCGVLPAASMHFDFVNPVARWFPAPWMVNAAPVHVEEVESALLEGMTAQPLDTAKAETVDVLVPLPDELYDPDILLQEQVDPAFQDAVNAAQQELTGVLQHREAIQQEANALAQALNGAQQAPPYDVTAGLTAAEITLLGPAQTVRTHSITAVYLDDLGKQVSTSDPLVQIVSSVLLVSSLNPAPQGQQVTFTVSILPPSATGNVTLSVDGKASGSAQPLSGGVAIFSVPSMSPGTHKVTASYTGDNNNPASVSPVLTQTVAPTGATLSVALTSSVGSSFVGQAVTLTAAVWPASSKGNVVFLDGTTTLGTVALNDGIAMLTISSLTAGNHLLSASYQPDSTSQPVNSAVVAQEVLQVTANVTLYDSANPSIVGQGITFTAVVSPSPATGSLQFMDGSTPLGAPVPLSGGQATLPALQVPVNETFGTAVSSAGSCVSQDLQKLLSDAASPPFTLFQDGNGAQLSQPLFLFRTDDMNDMATNGIQHFIDRINAKLAKANDLLDLTFVTAQSDTYRFRQYVLGNTAATALAVSPIAAQIATGESAAVTASNLQSYLTSVHSAQPPASTPSSTPPTTPRKIPPPSGGGGGGSRHPALASLGSTSVRGGSGIAPLPTSAALATRLSVASAGETQQISIASRAISSTTFAMVTPGTTDHPATPTDVQEQSPIVGATPFLRTLSIAARLKNSPSQEGLLYAVGNRVAFLNLLLALDLTVDDLPILVGPPQSANTPPFYIIADIRPGAAKHDAAFKAIQNLQPPPVTIGSGSTAPQLDPDEGSFFSFGIHVLEQHTALLRALEGRIQQYKDYVAECASALTNIQTYLSQAQTRVTQLENDLAQARQDLAFTTALYNDETVRVQNVNAQRMSTLQNFVQFVAFTRPRTVTTNTDVPNRQLVPGNIANPVPSCLQQSVAIPPELREIVALLREAPVNWLPSIAALLNRLERPNIFQLLAAAMQARASVQLAQPLQISSAASEPGVYAPVIASIYSSHQQVFRSAQIRRSAFQPALLVNQSWASQLQTLQTIAATGDLLATDAVHAEVVNATSRLLQQISRVATCVYARACQALPIDRLAWAEYLRGVGLRVSLQSLAVLPNWNTLDYVSRQQMQLLVDWLFLQIDTSIPNAVAFMSDVVRMSILLASDAPVNTVIGGAVTLATTPVVGGVVSLTLPSDRVAHGMYVQLYSSGTLAAQAVVTDLDSAGVRATVTHVYQAGSPLQPNDVAHFTSQAPRAVALRAFDM